MNTELKTTNETALVIAARDGDKEALRELLERQWHWLKGLVYNMLGNEHDVDDTLQNIFLLVMRHISGLREVERFRPWLATLARREALAFRQKRSKLPIGIDEPTAEALGPVEQVDQLDKLSQHEMCETVLKAINKLPEKYREVFLLKYSKDMSYGQISDVLELPVTTVQIRLVRARRMIQNHLNGLPMDKVPRT